MPAAAAACAALLLASCADPESLFSQLDGFAELIAARSDQLPTESERALLERYKPTIHLPAGHEGPLDFYRDYIAQGCLDAGDGSEPNCSVDRKLLNAHKADPRATFTHEPGPPPAKPVAYGSIWRGPVALPGAIEPEQEWTFLLYHYVFRHSGLPQGMDALQTSVLGAVGDLDDWHQLDHYTAVVVALDGRLRPMAAMFMQHNYMRTYLVGSDPSVGADGSVAADFALRSNEVYPHRAQRTEWPAASFISPSTVGYLAGVDDKPPAAAPDITHAERQISYELLHLPPTDAFYVFLGHLGERRRLPGRDGPPGAMFYTWPEYWPYEKSVAVYYMREQDHELVDAYDRLDSDELLDFQQQRLSAALCEAKLIETAC